MPTMPTHIASLPFITTRQRCDCEPATCSNGKCSLTGECIEQTAAEIRALNETLPRVESPSIVPDRCTNCDGYNCDDGCAYPGADTPSKRRTIIAFTGLAGSGKSTAAAHLVRHYGFHRVRFAGPLKNMMAALGCTEREIDGDRKEQPCALLGGKTPRYAMQTLGTEWGRDLITQDLWIRAWQKAVDELSPGTPVVVDDCRFPNEAEAVRAAGGVIVRIERPGAGTASVHASEQQQIDVTMTIRNAGDSAAVFCHRDVEQLVRNLTKAAK